MKRLLALLMICCLFTGCGMKADVNNDVVADPVETDMPEDSADDSQGGTVNTVSPLPTTIDLNALDNCTLAVSFEEGDAYVDDTGAMKLDVTVYTYDLYDMVDIANLKEGDTIVIRGDEVTVESLDTMDSGMVFINGGFENNGYDLWHNDTGVYYEQGMSDAKAYYALGEASIPVSVDFEFTDSSDLDKGEVIYYPGDFLIQDAGIMYHFVPDNTSIVIEGGKVIGMTRIYMP